MTLRNQRFNKNRLKPGIVGTTRIVDEAGFAAIVATSGPVVQRCRHSVDSHGGLVLFDRDLMPELERRCQNGKFITQDYSG